MYTIRIGCLRVYLWDRIGKQHGNTGNTGKRAESRMQSGGDIDRALSSIRARADHLRHTIGRLEHNLSWNPASTWWVRFQPPLSRSKVCGAICVYS